MPADPASERLAVVLFNLGGPDSPAAIYPFLRNLFSDPAILHVPFFVRPFLARTIARARRAPATANYALLGGRSPLLDLTRAQADALSAALTTALPGAASRCFVAMRYWHPFAEAVAREVAAWAPDRVVLLPLYPQYSTTTTGSSLTDWREAAARAGLVAETTTLCCYPTDPGYVAANARLVGEAYAAARAVLPATTGLRVLFSAHGLPQAIVDAGDPYAWQIGETVASVMQAWGAEEIDWRICYQSRATPREWLKPGIETAIEQAAHDQKAVLVVPIAFVSDHSETLVELDVEYHDLAVKLGVPGYFRAPVANADPGFIAALADLVVAACRRGPGLCSHVGGAICPRGQSDCPHHLAARS